MQCSTLCEFQCLGEMCWFLLPVSCGYWFTPGHKTIFCGYNYNESYVQLDLMQLPSKWILVLLHPRYLYQIVLFLFIRRYELQKLYHLSRTLRHIAVQKKERNWKISPPVCLSWIWTYYPVVTCMYTYGRSRDHSVDRHTIKTTKLNK